MTLSLMSDDFEPETLNRQDTQFGSCTELVCPDET